MLESLELRWFFAGSLPQSLKVFTEDPQSLPESRSDYYFMTNNDSLGIKIREKRLEIKWKGKDEIYEIPTLSVVGVIEQWIRWELRDIEAFNEIVEFLNNNVKNPCIKVDKKRIQKKYIVKNDSLLDVPSNSMSFDCALEFTELKIHGQMWWSLGFDLFSNNRILISKIFEKLNIQTNNMKLIKQNSYGYPRWLSKAL